MRRQDQGLLFVPALQQRPPRLRRLDRIDTETAVQLGQVHLQGRVHDITTQCCSGISRNNIQADMARGMSGTVLHTDSRFDLVTVIDHGGQVATVYAHQSEFLVEFGQEVRRGQIIGLVGSTGYSTGPHLHLELRLFGAPTDALPYLDVVEPVPCDVLIDSPYATDQALLTEARELGRC